MTRDHDSHDPMERRIAVVFGLLGAVAGVVLLLILLFRPDPRPSLPVVTPPPERIAQAEETVARPVRESGRLEGIVLDAETEEPIPGARIEALAPRTQFTDGVPRWGDLALQAQVTSGPDGRFALDALPPDYWNLFVRKEGWAWTTVPRSKFGEKHEIRLSRGATIRGQVLFPDESPAQGVRIQYTPQGTHSEVFSRYPAFRNYFDVKTDADGRFVFPDLPATKFTVEVDSPDHLPAPWTHEPALKPGEVRDLGKRVLDVGFGLRVRVVQHETGKGVPGVEVVVTPLVDPMPRTKTGQRRRTNAEGVALFQGLGGQVVPDPKFVVTVNDPVEGPLQPDNPRPFSPGEVVEIRLRGAKATVRGKVLRPDGRPLEQFYVTMEPVGHNRRPVPVWGENGAFEVKSVPAGAYSLLVRYGNLVDATVDDVQVVSGADTDVGTITMRSGAEIRGTVRRSSGKPLEKSVKVVLARKLGENEFRTVKYAYCQKDGTYALKGVPEGTFVIQPTDGDARTTPPLEVTIAGDTGFVEKDLVLYGIGRLRFQFLDLVDGRPQAVMQPTVWIRYAESGETVRWHADGTPLRPGPATVFVDLPDADGAPRRYAACEAVVKEGELPDPIEVRLYEIREHE